jgi:hypothetical protein
MHYKLFDINKVKNKYFLYSCTRFQPNNYNIISTQQLIMFAVTHKQNSCLAQHEARPGLCSSIFTTSTASWDTYR